jgi:glutamate formiminotransferase
MREYRGIHPCVGALDVLPVVYLGESDRELATDEALALANRISSELELPVFLYGELASGPDRAERAYFRDGGLPELTARMAASELAPDFGPARPHPTAGATLVTARPPLVAFNVELADSSLEVARQIAAELRESAGGLPGVRAIGLELPERGIVQVSTNIHDPLRVPLGEIVSVARRGARARGTEVSAAELVGLAPAAALEGLDLELLRDFDPQRHVLEARIGTRGRI